MCSRTKVAACAKHFVGDGGTTKGIDENNTVIDMNGLLNIHMPAYFDSILKGVSTIMVSYSSWNGKRMHANRDLITGFLKGKLKFRVIEQLSFKFYWSNIVRRLLIITFSVTFISGFCHIRLGGN